MQGKHVAAVIRRALGKGEASADEAKRMLKGAETDLGPDGKLTTTPTSR